MSAQVIEAIDGAVAELVPLLGAKAACQAVGMPRANYHHTGFLTPTTSAVHHRRERTAGNPALVRYRRCHPAHLARLRA